MWMEAAGALFLGKPLIISGPQRDRTIFTRLAIRVEQDNDVLTAIRTLETGIYFPLPSVFKSFVEWKESEGKARAGENNFKIFSRSLEAMQLSVEKKLSLSLAENCPNKVY